MKALLFDLYFHIRKRRRKQLFYIVLLMLLASVTEVISIGAVVPFLGVLANPEIIFDHEYTQPIINYLGLVDPKQLLLPFSIAFGAAALLSGIMRIALLWGQTRLAHAIGADISHKIYKNTLYQPYSVHIARNSSEVIAGISTKANQVVSAAVLPILTILASLLMVVMVLIALVAVNPIVTLSAIGGFVFIYTIFILISKKKLVSNSVIITLKSNQIVKTLQEGLGGIRDVLIDGTQLAYCAAFRSADLPLRRAIANNQIIAQIPRYGIESLGMVLIVALAYTLNSPEEGMIGALPLLGTLALGAQRMLPLLQQGYSSWTKIRGAQAVLQDALILLDQKIPEYAHDQSIDRIMFNDQIRFNDIYFSYSNDAPCVLRGLDLVVNKGESIGIIGTTGSGKSTLLDLVMALLRPTTGIMSVDGVTITDKNYRGWQPHIAHIPQNIFLSDSTICENIAFGLENDKIDFERVVKAAKQAQIHDTIMTLDDGYYSKVGERGVRLSGGQRQRIGIARALYKEADLLILDEATSALDSATENTVMNAIYENHADITMLIVAHRLSTLKNCDLIIELENGKIKQKDVPDNIIGPSSRE